MKAKEYAEKYKTDKVMNGENMALSHLVAGFWGEMHATLTSRGVFAKTGGRRGDLSRVETAVSVIDEYSRKWDALARLIGMQEGTYLHVLTILSASQNANLSQGLTAMLNMYDAYKMRQARR